MFNNIYEAIDWLIRQVRFRDKTDLSIMNLAYNKLNINLDTIKKVHIGGTNGKGSTNAFLSQILINSNLKVGSFTSPYLVNFNERIKINKEEINDQDLLKYINYFYNFNEELYKEFEVKLSFFEMITLMAFKYFKDNNVDIMVIEVGIGGRLDATNILNYDCSIITSIGFDHMKQLGNTLSAISFEKISILKPNGYLITGVNEPLKSEFTNYALKVGATIKFIDEKEIIPIDNNQFKYLGLTYRLSLLGDYQRMNALLASEAARYLFKVSDHTIIEALKITEWQGRLEAISPNVYIDGAHNEDAIKALVRNIKVIFKGKKITILYSALKGKDIAAMLNILKTASDKIILTAFDDFRYESLKPFETDAIKYQENSLEVLNNLISKQTQDDIIIVTGSLHFIGYIKKHFNN